MLHVNAHVLTETDYNIISKVVTIEICVIIYSVMIVTHSRLIHIYTYVIIMQCNSNIYVHVIYGPLVSMFSSMFFR